MWYFEKIPAEKIPEVLSAWERQNFRELIAIYNKYKVAPERLTPCCAGEAITLWTKWAIREGKLKA